MWSRSERPGADHFRGRSGAHRSLTVEEIFIFLTIGYLGLSEWGAGFVVRHVPCADVGAVLNIPKETVRRKANLLSERGLVSKNSHGVAVARIGEWLDLATAMLPKSRETKN